MAWYTSFDPSYMRGGPCTHRSCNAQGEGCRMLKPELIEPTDEDTKLADQLHAEGWISVSNRYRHLVRWKNRLTIDELLNPQHKNTAQSKYLRDQWERSEEWALRMARAGDEVEQLTLTLPQYTAFKRHLRDKFWEKHGLKLAGGA